MDGELQLLFIGELQQQCEFFDRSAQALDVAVNTQVEAFKASKSGDVPPDVDLHSMWAAIHGELTAAANISKLLWAQGTDSARGARRKPLRDLIGIPDDSPLNSRQLRNAFEHIDERLEDWYDEIAGGPMQVGTRNIGNVEPARMPIKHFGYFDYVRGNVTFWDRSISLLDLGREVAKLRNTLRVFMEQAEAAGSLTVVRPPSET